MLTPWRGDTAIEFCENPDRLLLFLVKRLPQIWEEGAGTPDEEEQTRQAMDRLIELCNGGTLPVRWQKAHLRGLLARVKPVKED